MVVEYLGERLVVVCVRLGGAQENLLTGLGAPAGEATM
jgi:hypothetical protein